MLDELPSGFSAILGGERKPASSAASPGMPLKGGPELTIVVPTLNERDNVGPLIDRLDRLLVGSSRRDPDVVLCGGMRSGSRCAPQLCPYFTFTWGRRLS